MEKNNKKDEKIDNLEQRIARIEQSLNKLIDNKNFNNTALKEDKGIQGKEAKALKDKISEQLNGKQGVHCYSYFTNGEVSSNSEFYTDIDKLLQIDAIEAERWFNAFAASERIEILQTLLGKNCTAGELMEKCGFSTTGKLYHHLNFLINTGIVKSDSGKFFLNASLVGSVLIMLLSASNFIRKLDKE